MSCIGCGENKIIFYPIPEPKSHKLILERRRDIDIMFTNSDLLKSAPKAPTGFRVTKIVDDTTADVEWLPLLTPFDYYRVYAFNTETEQIDSIVDQILGTTVDVRGLTENTLYRFWVVSVREGIESAHSNYDYGRTEPPE